MFRRFDGRRFLHQEDFQDLDEDIAACDDETVTPCTDQYTIYDASGQYDEIDGHLAINHEDHIVVGDAHANHCENKQSFLHDWLRRLRAVSRQDLQGYLNFISLTLNADNWFERILGSDFYR